MQQVGMVIKKERQTRARVKDECRFTTAPYTTTIGGRKACKTYRWNQSLPVI